MRLRPSALAPSAFHILLALSLRERHGYEIMRQVEEDSHGAVRMGPGTLYGALKRMLKDGLVEETGDASARPRRSYRLTRKGKASLAAELEKMEDVLALGRLRSRSAA